MFSNTLRDCCARKRATVLVRSLSTKSLESNESDGPPVTTTTHAWAGWPSIALPRPRPACTTAPPTRRTPPTPRHFTRLAYVIMQRTRHTRAQKEEREPCGVAWASLRATTPTPAPCVTSLREKQRCAWKNRRYNIRLRVASVRDVSPLRCREVAEEHSRGPGELETASLDTQTTLRFARKHAQTLLVTDMQHGLHLLLRSPSC